MGLKKTHAILASTGFFVAVLSLLVLVSLIGILIPQNAGDEAYAGIFGAAFSTVISRCGWDDIFYSPWFFLPLAALCVNLVFCLGGRLFRLVTAQRGGKKRTTGAAGSFILHSGVLVLMAGGILQYYSGDKQSIIIQEGGQETIEKFNTTVVLRGFSVLKDSSGAIVNYRSDLEIRDMNGCPALNAAALVNSPLKYRGLYLHQMNYGRVPNAVRDLRAVLADPAGDTLFNGTIPYQTTVALEKSGYSLRCSEFLCDFYYDFENRTAATRSHEHNNPAFKVTLFRNDAPIDSQWLFQRFPLINGGLGRYSAAIPSYTPLYYSGILVQKKPGTFLILAGIIIVSIGLTITLLFPLRRRKKSSG
jgi:cytochrome c biogenesis protein ResB